MGERVVEILVERLEHAGDLPLPSYMTPGSAAMDLLAAVADERILEPGRTELIPTGLKLALPSGYELQIRPRSGLALKHRLVVLNSPGTIDSDYRGEVQVILSNFGEDTFRITRGMRICQAVLARVLRAELRAVPSLPASSRGEGGFGHTGQ